MNIGNLRDLKELADPNGTFREIAFGALVGLVAKHSGGTEFLGDTSALAAGAYQKSLIGDYFPNYWMEVPLLGNPGFDLHVYYNRGQVDPGDHFESGCGFGMQAMFDWYFNVETGGVGVGFAHDLRDGSCDVGAYVNFGSKPLADERGFFTSLEADGSYGYTSELLARLPGSWQPWYLGLFPNRPGSGVRVGAFVSVERQADYAADPRTLADDLTRAGFTAFDSVMLERLQALAALPFILELQLDAVEGGVGDTLGADLTLKHVHASDASVLFAKDAPGEKACRLLEAWGVVDSRWHRIPDASISCMLPIGEGGKTFMLLMRCNPSFIKSKWVATQPQPAKVYFQCTTLLFGSQQG